MLSSFSSNTLLAKSRAKYGRRLTKQNYDDLLACQTVNEVAYYLKNHTDYAGVLAGINENDIHRGQLETKLKQKMFEDYASLCRYEITIGEDFAQYLIAKSDIEQILHSLLHMQAETPQENVLSMPTFLNRHTRIDLVALGRITTYDDLLNAVSHTPYRKLLEPFRPTEESPLDYTAIENVLYTYLYQSAFDAIKKNARGETAKQLRDLFNTYIDMKNYIYIMRLKTYYEAEPEAIKKCLLPFGNIQGRVLEEMIHAQNAEELTKLMGKTSIGKRFLKVEHDYIDQVPERTNYLTCRHGIHFSVHPSVVMMSYLFLAQTEVSDLINIIEGIRYKLAPNEIAKLLTIASFQ
ncbi:MAG TPA: V-type ATPase subunit [Oscillospiraceae bacterium]|nr:V-type ATPase subunit [Oscillospiraceae bacterium]